MKSQSLTLIETKRKTDKKNEEYAPKYDRNLVKSPVFVLQVCFYKVTAEKINLSLCLFSQPTEREDDK